MLWAKYVTARNYFSLGLQSYRGTALHLYIRYLTSGRRHLFRHTLSDELVCTAVVRNLRLRSLLFFFPLLHLHYMWNQDANSALQMPACTVVPSPSVSLSNTCWSKTTHLQFCRARQLLNVGPDKVKDWAPETLVCPRHHELQENVCAPQNPHPNSEHVWADWTLMSEAKHEEGMRGRRPCSECPFFVLLGSVYLQDEDERFFRHCNREAKNWCSTAVQLDRWNIMSLWRRCFQKTKHNHLVRTQLWANTHQDKNC